MVEYDERDEGRRLKAFFGNPRNLRYNLNTIIPVLVFLTSILSAAVVGWAVKSTQTHLILVLGVAGFSAFCSLLVVLAMTQPVKAIMVRAEKMIKFEESRKEKGQMIEVYQLIERLMDLAGERNAGSRGHDEGLVAGVENLDYIIPLGYMSLMVAHEVRNPLSTITGMTELLKGKTDDPTQTTYLNTILDASKKIDLFTNDLLDFTDGELVREHMDIRDVVEEALNSVRAQFTQVKCDFAGDQGCIFDGDRHRIYQAVQNIVKNALEFERSAGPEGLVTVSIECGDELMALRISNRHSRIEPEDMGSVFKPFFTKKKGGRGIGLFIAMRNVKMHGGEIKVESGEDGTTFTIMLPVKEVMGSKR